MQTLKDKNNARISFNKAPTEVLSRWEIIGHETLRSL
jgi:hypothetical protein